MTQEHNDLETVTVITFHDGDQEFARSYKGLLEFTEGAIINLRPSTRDMPVSPGEYILKRSEIHNQLGLALEDETQPDSLYRYYEGILVPR
jgi:hypothetical protein